MRRGPVATLLAAAFLSASASATGAPPAAPGDRPSILLVTLDTTRADHVGAWGWRHARTPVLDGLARDGTRFEACDTAAVTTLPSHATILTGVFPPKHRIRDNGSLSLREGVPALPEILRSGGWDTAAVVSAVVLARRFGLGRGFRVYDDDLGAGYSATTAVAERPAGAATDAALARLRELRSPFFMWVHYFDPHDEYRAPRDVRETVGGPTAGYDAEIAYVDRELGRLLAAVPQSTLVVVVGDHGEMLGEHGEATHGLLPYRAARRVPLLLRGAAVPRGRVVRSLVRTADVTPTILELAHVATPGGLDGLSLVPVLSGEEPPSRTTYTEAFHSFFAYGWYPLRSLSDGRSLYVDAPRPSLFDLRSDPGEARDVAASRATEAAAWKTRLTALAEEDGKGAAPDRGSSEEDLRALRSLGYLGGPAPRAVSSALPDPRERMEDDGRVRRAADAAGRGRWSDALSLLDPVLRRPEPNGSALSLAGFCLLVSGEAAKAVDVLRRAEATGPGTPETATSLGLALARLGRLEESDTAFRRALELDRAAGRAAVELSRSLRSRGRAEEALAVLDGVVEAGGRTSDVLQERGEARIARGGLADALEDFREAARKSPQAGRPLEWAARVAVRLGRWRDAANLYERLVRLEPAMGRAWIELGDLYRRRLGERREALRCYRAAFALERTAPGRKALDALIRQLQE